MIKIGNGIVKSVNRAIMILEKLLESPDPLGVTDLSNRLDYNKSTTHGLLKTLECKNYVVQTKNKKYELGLKLYELGEAVKNRLDLIAIAQKHLDKLVEEHGETAHLITKRGREALYLCKSDPPKGLMMYSQIGKSVPLYCTGVGKALLAFLPIEERELIIEDITFIEYTNNTIKNKEELRKHLNEIANNGYSIDNEEIEIGLRCIGVPTFSADGEVMGAISIAGPAGRITDERINPIIDSLKKTSKSISAAVGYIAR